MLVVQTCKGPLQVVPMRVTEGMLAGTNPLELMWDSKRQRASSGLETAACLIWTRNGSAPHLDSKTAACLIWTRNGSELPLAPT